MAENEAHDNADSSAAIAAASNVRWWQLPFDTSTNFSLLGFFVEEYFEEPDSGKKVDLDLK